MKLKVNLVPKDSNELSSITLSPVENSNPLSDNKFRDWIRFPQEKTKRIALICLKREWFYNIDYLNSKIRFYKGKPWKIAKECLKGLTEEEYTKVLNKGDVETINNKNQKIKVEFNYRVNSTNISLYDNKNEVYVSLGVFGKEVLKKLKVICDFEQMSRFPKTK